MIAINVDINVRLGGIQPRIKFCAIGNYTLKLLAFNKHTMILHGRL